MDPAYRALSSRRVSSHRMERLAHTSAQRGPVLAPGDAEKTLVLLGVVAAMKTPPRKGIPTAAKHHAGSDSGNQVPKPRESALQKDAAPANNQAGAAWKVFWQGFGCSLGLLVGFNVWGWVLRWELHSKCTRKPKAFLSSP